MVAIGDVILYVDPEGKGHPALVTDVFDRGGQDPAETPSVNLVYVSADPNARDQYGRQLAERQTSVVHRDQQAAHAFYWQPYPHEFAANPGKAIKDRLAGSSSG